MRKLLLIQVFPDVEGRGEADSEQLRSMTSQLIIRCSTLFWLPSKARHPLLKRFDCFPLNNYDFIAVT